MTSKKKLAIANYGIKNIDDKLNLLDTDIQIYSLDGHPFERAKNPDECAKYNMASHVGLPSSHCCDCFIFMKDAIALIEITQLLRAKKEVDKILSILRAHVCQDKRQGKHQRERQDELEYIINDINLSLVVEYIILDNISKVYGGMLVLHKFSHYCEVMKNHICCDEKKYEFWLVASPDKSQNARGIDMIIKELQGLGKLNKQKYSLENRLQSVAGDNDEVKVKVKILHYDKLKDEIKNEAVPI